MTTINNDQKELLFDHSLGLTSDSQARQAEQLICASTEAAELYRMFRATFDPLDTIEQQPCPDILVERTISKLKAHKDAGQERLEALLAGEQSKSPQTLKIGFWHNFGEMAAIAAAIILFASVLLPTLSLSRNKYWKQRCQKQMGNIFKGLSSYINENDGKQPGSPIDPGTYWCKVGYQGEENHSSTRPMWVLVKFDYCDPADFVCPGRSEGRPLQFDVLQVRDSLDFPARRYITYSPRIRCTQEGNTPLGHEPLLSDSNPIFEDISADLPQQFIKELNKNLLTINSRNHQRKGQNILFGDGSIEFKNVRTLGSEADDIFTLQNMSQGSTIKGDETPTCEADVFFAP